MGSDVILDKPGVVVLFNYWFVKWSHNFFNYLQLQQKKVNSTWNYVLMNEV